MAKKTLEQKIDALTRIIDERFARLEARIEKRFGAAAEDIASVRKDMATKDQIIALHTQVNSIETDIRSMKHAKPESA